MSNVYAISLNGLKVCPKEELLIEKYIPREGLLNKFLRLLRDNGPKTDEQVFEYLNTEYRNSEIKRMIDYTKARGLIDCMRNKTPIL